MNQVSSSRLNHSTKSSICSNEAAPVGRANRNALSGEVRTLTVRDRDLHGGAAVEEIYETRPSVDCRRDCSGSRCGLASRVLPWRDRMNIAYPLSGSALRIDLTTTGPAVLGGFALIALGLLLLVWALLAAVVHQFSLLASREDRTDSIFRRDRDREIPFDDERHPGSLGLTGRRREG